MSDFPTMDNHVSAEIQSQPNSREAEEAVLGSVLIYPESYYEIAQILHADDFYVIRNQWLWEVFTRLHDRRVPIDLLTVSEDLEEHGQLTEIGGQGYLTSLVNQTPSSLHAEAYAKIVEQNAVRRRMLASANELAKLAYDQEKPIDTIIDEAEQNIFGLSERRVAHDLVPIAQVVSETYDHVSELSQRDEELFGVPTGLTDLDRLLGGLQKSDLLIVAGRPGSGKTGLFTFGGQECRPKAQKTCCHFLAGNVERAACAASHRTGDAHRYPASAYRQARRTRMGIVHPGDRSAGRYPHLAGRYAGYHPAAITHQVPPPAHGIRARPGDR
jgi:replicative DNA helicase